MAKNLSLAIVGCGDIARFMALAGKLNRRIELCACVDVNAERVRKFSRWFRIPRSFTDYGEMLNQAGLDAVYLAVPHSLHYPMIKEALAYGAHVFCEKPIATTLDDALDICRLARKSGLKVGVNYQYRYDTGCYALANASQEGKLGQILYGKCNVPWHREVQYFAYSPWHGCLEASGGGTLITQASHALDILLWAYGRKPVTALGAKARQRFKDVEVEDLCMGIIEMEDGGLLEVTGSMVATPEQRVTIEIYGSHGTGLYSGPALPRVRFKGLRIKKAKPPVKGLHALLRSLEGFRKWVMEGQPYLTPVEQSLPVLAVIASVYRSAVTGKREEVDRRFIDYLIQ